MFLFSAQYFFTFDFFFQSIKQNSQSCLCLGKPDNSMRASVEIDSLVCFFIQICRLFSVKFYTFLHTHNVKSDGQFLCPEWNFHTSCCYFVSCLNTKNGEKLNFFLFKQDWMVHAFMTAWGFYYIRLLVEFWRLKKFSLESKNWPFLSSQWTKIELILTSRAKI